MPAMRFAGMELGVPPPPLLQNLLNAADGLNRRG
ncbi:hypothetical protein SAMN05216190_113112 [Pseudomonas borbori]|uniref:Uncharacterized protein n=1 Tax=Pseudomonas borbori TaxID=289003 RepID=A0A1I5RP26_9PSED|nr:hypothetical protein SAMN05216190_113112 [Pseudomonas borbori]